MQIGDLFSQYQNNISAGSSIATGVRGVEQVTDTVAKLQAGQVFEGSVTEVKGDKVTLSLSNGQSISARLEGDVNLGKGESVFFEVKSNDGATVQIRPVSMGITNNPTLLNALSQAGLSASERNINMVQQMMKEQLPIDSKSLLSMSQNIGRNPGADPSTIVSMTKLGIPVTKEMVSQFENYKANEGTIMKAYSEMVDSMASSFSGENVSVKDVADFQKNLVSVLQLSGEEEQTTVPVKEEGVFTAETVEKEALLKMPEEPQIQPDKGAAAENVKAETANILKPEAEIIVQNDQSGAVKAAAEEKTAEVLKQPTDIVIKEEAPKAEMPKEQLTRAEVSNEPVKTAEVSNEAVNTPKTTDYPKNTLGSVLTEQDASALKDMLKNHPEMLDREGKIDLAKDTAEFMNKLTDVFQKSGAFTKEDLLKMISSDPYKKLMNDLMEKQWTVKPEELKREDKIGKLYEKLETHLQHLEETAKQLSGNSENLFSKAAQSVRDNIEFMNQVNQMATYVQIPLKFSEQSATGDLYVYRNKKGGNADSDELTAFLHFDLDHLGSTDISVKLKGKNVDTQFFMADDASYDLIEKNLPILEKRLQDKGYFAKITVTNDSNPVDFVNDFLAKDVPVMPEATMQRFSFDVRA